MAASLRPIRPTQLDQENDGIARRRALRTPGHAGVLDKGLQATVGRRKQGSETVKETERVLGKHKTATDIGPQRSMKGTMTAPRTGLLLDKTNKTPHPSMRKTEAGSSKASQAPSPTKEALQRAQLVTSPKTPAKSTVPTVKQLSPAVQQADYAEIKTPSPNQEAKRRGEAAPFTPPVLEPPTKPLHESDLRRQVEWETLEEREVEYALGPTATPLEPAFVETTLTPEFLEDWAELNRSIPILPCNMDFDYPTPPLSPLDTHYIWSSDGYLTDSESEEEAEEAITPPRALPRPALIGKDPRANTAPPKGPPRGVNASHLPASAVPSGLHATGPRSSRTAGQITGNHARSSSVQNVARVPASMPRSTSTTLMSSIGADTRIAASRSGDRKLPSFMAPTAASLAKQPPASHRKASQPAASRQLSTRSEQVDGESALSETETSKEVGNAGEAVTAQRRPKVRWRRPIFGPITESKAKELQEAEDARKRIHEELYGTGNPDVDHFGALFDAYMPLLDDLLVGGSEASKTAL